MINNKLSSDFLSVFEVVMDFSHSNHLALFFIINGILIGFCVICLYIIKIVIPTNVQKEELGSLGSFLSGIVAGMYAVSAGFVLIYLLGNFNKAEETVASESIALMRIADTASWFPDSLRSSIYKDLIDYTNHVLTVEWLLMRNGERIDSMTIDHLQNIIQRIKAYEDDTPMQLFIKQEIVKEVRHLYNVRYNRIKMSYFTLNLRFWIIVIILTAVNLVFVCVLGIKRHLHMGSIILVSITVSSMIFMLFTLNKPFRGQFAVPSYDLQKAITYINQLE